MVINHRSSLIGTREWVGWGVLTGVLIGCRACQFELWSVVTVAVLFISYASWSSTSFLVATHHFKECNLIACVWPIGIAIAQTFISFGLARLTVWLAHRLLNA